MFEETFGELIVMVLSSGRPRKVLEVWFGVTTKLPQIPYFDLWKTSLPRQHGLGKCVSWETTPGEQIGTYKRHLRFEGSRSWRWFFVLETLAGKQRRGREAVVAPHNEGRNLGNVLVSDRDLVPTWSWESKLTLGSWWWSRSEAETEAALKKVKKCVLKWTRGARIEE